MSPHAIALDGFVKSLRSDKPDFEINVADNTKLQKVLTEELKKQRQGDAKLQQFHKPGKIARYESELLTARLHANGYYGATVNASLEEQITYDVVSGPVYTVSALDLHLPAGVGVSLDVLGLKTGDPVEAQAVLNAKKALSNHVANTACLYRVDSNYRVILDHSEHNAQVSFSIAESPIVHFGTITFTGLQSIEENYLRDRLSIKEGDCFSRQRLDTSRLALVQTNLLAGASVQYSQPRDDRVNVTLGITERHHRTVSAGIGFVSDEGFGVSSGWEHRNLWGRAEELSVDAKVAEREQSLSAGLRIPNYIQPEQYITYYTDFIRENNDAFDSKTGSVGVEISRELAPHLRGLVGTEISFSDIEDDGMFEKYALLSFPLSLEYDRRNDLLDPRSGWVAAGRLRPYWDAANPSTTFLSSTLAASSYYTLENIPLRPTLAVRGAVGSISGADVEDVPANVRFYAGGGGSVRGYKYQTLGPLTDEDPDGGLSYTEVSFETRLHWNKNWGGVFFLDGGWAYEDEVPEWGENLRWGTGFGIRYYSSFAPIRFDFAVPLDQRDDIDDDFQIYISIGQAF